MVKRKTTSYHPTISRTHCRRHVAVYNQEMASGTEIWSVHSSVLETQIQNRRQRLIIVIRSKTTSEIKNTIK